MLNFIQTANLQPKMNHLDTFYVELQFILILILQVGTFLSISVEMVLLSTRYTYGFNDRCSH